jgi:hypothetical protein
MRKLIFALALSGVSLGFSGMASADRIDAASCRPLTSDNMRACCSAANWKSLVRTSDRGICLGRQSLAVSPPAAVGTPPGSTTPPDDTNPPENPPGTADKGVNNGFGNGDQTAPGNSLPHNTAENANGQDIGGRNNPSNSPNSTN